MDNRISRENLTLMLNALLEENDDWQYQPGAIIRRRRNDLGMSVQQLAKETEIFHKTIQNIESKQPCNSSWDKVINLLNTLGIRVYFEAVDDIVEVDHDHTH